MRRAIVLLVSMGGAAACGVLLSTALAVHAASFTVQLAGQSAAANSSATLGGATAEALANAPTAAGTSLAWLAFGLMLALSGVISCSETALFSLDKLDVVRLRNSHHWNDRAILTLLLRPNATLITLMIINNVLNIAASLMAGTAVRGIFGDSGAAAFFAAAVVATTGVLLIGEILPKTVGHLFPHRTARILAPLIVGADWVLYPVRRVLNLGVNATLRLMGIPLHASPDDDVTEEELKVMISSGEISAVLEDDERQMIDGVFELRHTVVAEILNPRMAMVALPDDLNQEDMAARLRQIPHSRVPIYHESLDQLLGFLLSKEVLLDTAGPWRRHLREALCVPERIGLLDLLKMFRKQRTKIAIVVDEYGGVSGMVTLQDLLEEIVGDIYEKHEAPQRELAALAGGRWHIAGTTLLEEAGRRLGVQFPEHKGRTIGGFVMNTLGHVPRTGDAVEFEGLRLRVDKMAARRIVQVDVSPIEPPPGTNGQTEADAEPTQEPGHANGFEATMILPPGESMANPAVDTAHEGGGEDEKSRARKERSQ